MRRFMENKSAVFTVMSLFALAFASNVAQGSGWALTARPLVSLEVQIATAHGPGMPPDPWEKTTVAHGPGMPPDPWEKTTVAHGPGMPPDPWEKTIAA